MESLLNYLPALGHILIGFYFAFFGFWNIYHWRPILNDMITDQIPSPFLLLTLGISWQSICGIMIIFGFYTKIAALLLIPFIIGSVFIFHPFWRFKAEHRRLNFSLFTGNLTISLGALILLLTTISPLTSLNDLLS